MLPFYKKRSFCKVTGRRRYSTDLPQGGLEIPCAVLFTAKDKRGIDNLENIITCQKDAHSMINYD